MSSETSGGLIPHSSGESADVLGMKVIFRVTKEMTGGAYSLTNVAQPGDAGVPMHTHRNDHETMIVQRGCIVCRVGDVSRPTPTMSACSVRSLVFPRRSLRHNALWRLTAWISPCRPSSSRTALEPRVRPQR
jgi:hypothetical protein